MDTSTSPSLEDLLLLPLSPPPHNYNPDYDLDSFSMGPWLNEVEEYTEVSLPGYDALFTSTLRSVPESTMGWFSQNCREYCPHLRYACYIFRYYMVISVPYYNILHVSHDPIGRRRTMAELCWRLACDYFAGRIVLAVDSNGRSWHDNNPGIIFSTVRFRAGLPEKIQFLTHLLQIEKEEFHAQNAWIDLAYDLIDVELKQHIQNTPSRADMGPALDKFYDGMLLHYNFARVSDLTHNNPHIILLTWIIKER